MNSNSSPQTQIGSLWPHRLAVLLCCATFPLVWVGGLVTTYKAGMSVPDWPNTFGYNLFLYPWKTWVFGPWDVFVEHGHRLFASAVGMLTILLLVAILRHDSRRWMRWLGCAALGLVIGQGVLGGMRVRMNAELFAQIHGCVGPAFFAFTAALAVLTSRRWMSHQPLATDRQAGKMQRLAVATTLLAYVQLVLGSQLRHLPADADPALFRAALVFHLLVAAALAVHVALLAIRAGRRHRDRAELWRPALALVGMLGLQLLLGVAAYVTHYGWPSWLSNHAWTSDYTVEAHGFAQAHLTTAHVALGSLILATSLTLALRSFRALRGAPGELSQPNFAPPKLAQGAAG